MNKEDKPLKVAIKTFGCQMNDYDSDLALGMLKKQGYSATQKEEDADVILFNTCSVREHAEDRVFNQIAELRLLKQRRPDVLIGVMGCMVENYKTKFFDDFPQVDLLIGTRSIQDLPKAIEKARSERIKVSEIKKTGFGYEFLETPRMEGKHRAFLPIMTGCDKVCSFCIVPYVRGPEISRRSREVIDEVKRLSDLGVKHITLLGQNVNSYGSKLTEEINFSKLLREVAKITGIEKISFTTSHPQDAYEELFLAIRDEEKISRRFHLPLQSGSDEILKRMRRDHTLAEYRVKIDRMRELVPDISITTDIICGFPGESEQDYESTKKAIQDICFDGAFIFKYSARPHTGAARYDDHIPDEEKTRRVTELLRIEKKIMRANNEKWIGKICKVMIHERSKKSAHEVLAHNWRDNKVVFPGSADEAGKILNVRLKELYNETFLAERVSHCETEGRSNPSSEIASAASQPRNDISS